MPRSIPAPKLLAGALLSASMQMPAHGETEGSARRADRETRAVLQTLIAEEVGTIRPCELSDTWVVNRPLDFASARKHLGLNLRVDVMAPEGGPNLIDVLAPDKAMARNFCDEETFRIRWKQLFEDFSAGRIEGDVPPYGGLRREVKRRRVAFGAPVFDARFRTAAVYAQFETVTRSRNPDGLAKYPSSYLPNGIRKRDDLSAAGIRYIYRKSGKAWVKIAEDLEFSAH